VLTLLSIRHHIDLEDFFCNLKCVFAVETNKSVSWENDFGGSLFGQVIGPLSVLRGSGSGLASTRDDASLLHDPISE
jgi:hypothetical protein